MCPLKREQARSETQQWVMTRLPTADSIVEIGRKSRSGIKERFQLTHKHRSSVNFGARHFWPKMHVWKINKMCCQNYAQYLKKIKYGFRNFKLYFKYTWNEKQNTVKKWRVPILPSSKNISTAQMLHDDARKIFFSRIGGGATAPCPHLLLRLHTSSQLTSFYIKRPNSPWLRPVTAHSVEMKCLQHKYEYWRSV